MALPSFRKKAQTISITQVRSGQVLEIEYDGDTDLILVIDPNATTVTTSSQGRTNKLHAIKLHETGLSDTDLIDLIQELRSLGRTPTPTDLYNKFKTSKYNTGTRSYRTYSPNKITNIMRITVGQLARRTNKLVLSNGSVLYGVVHGSYVEILPEDYDDLQRELEYVRGRTFYEGGDGHENVTKDLLKYLYKNSIKAESWEPVLREDVSAELYRVTELFGGGSDVLWKQLQSIVKDRDIPAKNMTLVEVMAVSSGPAPAGKTEWWTSGKTTEQQIRELVKLSGVNDSLLDKPYDTVSKSEFITFHLEIQRRAFASYEGDEYKEFVGSAIERKTTLISRIRQRSLYKLMRKIPAIYFAGTSHVDDLKRFII